MIDRWTLAHLAGEIIGKRVRQNEIAVRQTLHERTRAETVSPVIGKIGFADDEQSRHVGRTCRLSC